MPEGSTQGPARLLRAAGLCPAAAREQQALPGAGAEVRPPAGGCVPGKQEARPPPPPQAAPRARCARGGPQPWRPPALRCRAPRVAVREHDGSTAQRALAVGAVPPAEGPAGQPAAPGAAGAGAQVSGARGGGRGGTRQPEPRPGRGVRGEGRRAEPLASAPQPRSLATPPGRGSQREG